MSSSQHFSVGTIGAGTLEQAVAGHAVALGHHVIFSNSRARESLEPLASRFGARVVKAFNTLYGRRKARAAAELTPPAIRSLGIHPDSSSADVLDGQ
jgi:hypothetical protein